MSVTLIIVLVVLVLFIGLIVINYYRMKNAPHVPDSKKILTLSNKNYKTFTGKKGIVLVDFWASWCGPCKLMVPVLNELAEEMEKEVTIGKVNVENLQNIAKKAKVRNIPTLVLFKDGEEITRFVGVKSKRIIAKEIRQLT